MKQKITKKPRQIQLEFHKACRNCKARCIYNRLCTTKTKNQSASDMKYGCNTTKFIQLKTYEITEDI